MESNAISQIGALATVLGILASLVGVIFWFARLEGKVSKLAEAREEDKKARHVRELERDVKIEKLEAQLAAHRENAEIHFNLRLHQEIERRQDDRFRRVEGRLGHIEEKLDDLLKRD